MGKRRRGPPVEPQIDALKALSQGATGYLLDISSPTVKAWGAPRNSDDTYDAQQVVKWFVAREAADQQVAVEALERKRSAEADIAEMKRDVMRGELLPADKASEVFRHALENHIRPALDRLGHVSRDVQTSVIEAFQRAIEEIRESVNGDKM